MQSNETCATAIAHDVSKRLFPRPGRPLALLLLSSAALLILWSFAVPIFEAPDEPHHWDYAQYLHQHKELPFYNSVFIEANQPPLYYLLMSPFASPSATPPFAVRLDATRKPVLDFPPRHYLNTTADFKQYWPIRISRLVTCIMSLLTVYFAYLSGAVAAGNASTGLLTGGLAAFLPQFTFRGMNVSNDALVTMTSAAAIYVIVCLIKRGFGWSLGLIAAVSIGLAFLSKVNAVILVVPLALAILSQEGRWLDRLRGLWVIGAAIVIAAPWLVHNRILYGDILASKAMLTVLPEATAIKPISSPYFHTVFPSLLSRSFVGVFGWMNVFMSERLYQCYAAIGILGAMGYLWSLARRRADLRLTAVLLTVPIVSLLSTIQLNLSFSQPQGRYLFPALTAIALLTAIGLEALPRWNRACTIVMVVILGLVNVGVLFGTVVPAYWSFPEDYTLERIDVSVPPAYMRAPLGPLAPDASYAQSFVAHHRNLIRVEVMFSTYLAAIEAGQLTMHLRRTLDPSADITSRTIPLRLIADNSYVGLPFSPIPDSDGQTYYIVFEARDNSQPITVWMSAGDVYPEGPFFAKGRPLPQRTCFRTFYNPNGN
jgi:4-amino-4-deoxy-L-arabinose transferase-like glycosyltransferase